MFFENMKYIVLEYSFQVAIEGGQRLEQWLFISRAKTALKPREFHRIRSLNTNNCNNKEMNLRLFIEYKSQIEKEK